MAQFTVRVELHSATSENYETLHSAMERNGFKRFLVGVDASGNRGTWAMPTAEYDYEGEYTAEQVREFVKPIAYSAKIGAWILVTQVAGRSWITAKTSAQ